MKQVIAATKFIVILLILLKIVVNSIALSVNSICEFYQKKVPGTGIFFRDCNDLLFHKFWSYTGFDTGYGFFAPNVASDFVVVNKMLYTDGRTVTKFSDSPLHTREGKVRFTVLNQRFMDKITAKDTTNTYSNQYFTILLKRLNAAAPVENGVKAVTTTLYLYDYQKLAEYKNKPLFKLYKIDEYIN